MKLTEEQKKKYLEHGGYSCPYCGCGNIEGQSIDFEECQVTQEVTCTECGEYWRDSYTLTGIQEAEE